jgi:hypothetical protein
METTTTTGLTMSADPAVAPLPKKREMEFFEERPKVDLEIDQDGKVLSLKHDYKQKPNDADTRAILKFPQGLE